MFDTGKSINLKSINFDQLALSYVNQRTNELETPEDYLTRFIHTRYRMEQRFDEELKAYQVKHPISAPPMSPRMDSIRNNPRF